MFTEEGIQTVTKLIQLRSESAARGLVAGPVTFEVEHRCKDGRLLWGEVFSKPEFDADGGLLGFHGITREITQRRQIEDEIRQMAYFDPLTKLCNRRLMNDRLSQVMATSEREGHYSATIFMDLDNFKPLNDLHGHEVGDLLLIEVAERLTACVRKADSVARLGGDEFVVILGELGSARDESETNAQNVAEKIRGIIATPYCLQSKNAPGAYIEHHCTASMGVAIFKGLETPANDILKIADMAMYAAKKAGRNQICTRWAEPELVQE